MIRTFFSILLLAGIIGASYWYWVQSALEEKPRETWGIVSQEKLEPSYDEVRKSKEADAMQDEVIYNEAMKEQDIKVCEKIASSTEKLRCQDMILAGEALRGSDEKKCDTLSNSGIALRCRDNVFFASAETLGEKQKCESISDENLKIQCEETIDSKNLNARIASGTVDSTFCAELSETIRESCQARVTHTADTDTYTEALVTKKITDCDTIENTIMREQCRDALIFDIANRDGDIELCVSISNIQRAEYCKKSLTDRLDAQRYQSIIKEGEITNCNELTSVTLKNQCHDTFIIAEVRKNQDTSYCDSLYNTGMIAGCLEIVRK